MGKKGQATTLSANGTDILKAVAIIAVLVIHTLSSLKQSPFVNSSSFQIIGVSLDQLARLSVPLFVALSGYGLSISYAKKKYNVFDFIFKRFLKVVPLFVLWSIFFIIMFNVVPAWSSSSDQPNFIWKLLLGRADYHLYFVPMIFQLYLIFPLIYKIFKRWPLLTLLGSIGVQFVWWYFYSYLGWTVTSWRYFEGDGEQYLWMTNWVAYFVLGMYLPKIWTWLDKSKLLVIMLGLILLSSAAYSIFNAVSLIQGGLDPLYALKFTRYPLFVYSSAVIIVLSYFVARMRKFNERLIKIGKHSYLIYLSHTFFLRIIFSFL
jgi:surface polysaccharide O-acyltransferase-like enzyme